MNYPNLTLRRDRDGSFKVEGWEKAIARLQDLACQDPGYFYLAGHSVVESYINLLRPELEAQERKFYDKVNSFNYSSKGLKIPQGFTTSYNITNGIRHNFDNVNCLDQKRVGQLLIEFFVRNGLSDLGEFKSFKKYLDSIDTTREFKTASERLAQKEAELALSAGHINSYFERIRLLNEQISEKDREQAHLLELKHQLEERIIKKDGDLDEKRREIFRLEQEQIRRAEAIKEQTETRQVLEEILNLHHFSKTSLDYEQNLMQLSAQQKKVLESFKPGSNLLVRGGAGTGKTMVLIEAVKSMRKASAASLGFETEAKIVFLTFTKTLSSYGKYLSDLLAQGEGFDDILTVDKYLNELAKKLWPEPSRIDWQYDQQFQNNEVEKSHFEELEGFVWARNLDYQSYVTNREPRHGRKTPITPEKRQAVWDFGQKLLAEMSETRVFSKMGHRYLLAQTTAKVELKDNEKPILVIDEVQDLAPVELKILAWLAKNYLLAGDSRQSIFQRGFSFKSVGIDIVNQSHVLKRNFRNPRAIHELAQRFLQHNNISEDETEISVARDGLPPRLSKYDTRDLKPSIKTVLDFYRGTLGYEIESIAILSCGIALKSVASAVSDLGIEAFEIKKNEDDWVKKKGLRLSTVESAKGLDLPVVVLVCGTGAEFDLSEEERRLAKSRLLYVGLTRALENLTVLIPEGTNDSVLLSLEGSFEHGR